MSKRRDALNYLLQEFKDYNVEERINPLNEFRTIVITLDWFHKDFLVRWVKPLNDKYGYYLDYISFRQPNKLFLTFVTSEEPSKREMIEDILRNHCVMFVSVEQTENSIIIEIPGWYPVNPEWLKDFGRLDFHTNGDNLVINIYE